MESQAWRREQRLQVHECILQHQDTTPANTPCDEDVSPGTQCETYRMGITGLFAATEAKALRALQLRC